MREYNQITSLVAPWMDEDGPHPTLVGALVLASAYYRLLLLLGDSKRKEIVESDSTTLRGLRDALHLLDDTMAGSDELSFAMPGEHWVPLREGVRTILLDLVFSVGLD